MVLGFECDDIKVRHVIAISRTSIKKAFEVALSYSPTKRGDFFHDVRQAFKHEIESEFAKNNIRTFPNVQLGSIDYKHATIVKVANLVKSTGSASKPREELDADFCARYGHDDYSLKAINYLDHGYCELPSISPFSRAEAFSLGNIVILVENGDYEIELEFEDGLSLTGYASQIAQKKKKSFVCLFGVWFDKEILSSITTTPNNPCEHQAFDLDEVRIGTISYPIMFICRRCGQLFTCSCFRDYFSVRNDIIRFLPYGNSEPNLQEQIEKMQIRDHICHMCTENVPKLEYGSAMYYSSFLQRYLPYHVLFSRRLRCEILPEVNRARQIEDEVREHFGYPKIGESWISETLLFRVVKMLISPREVVHHYRGAELQGLELDIWIPDLQVGIEYQGEQHYQIIEHWGGEEGFRKQQENDLRKRMLCKSLGYTLIEFKYSEDTTDEAVRKKLAPYLASTTEKA